MRDMQLTSEKHRYKRKAEDSEGNRDLEKVSSQKINQRSQKSRSLQQ